jgi:hypothetical protein
VGGSSSTASGSCSIVSSTVGSNVGCSAGWQAMSRIPAMINTIVNAKCLLFIFPPQIYFDDKEMMVSNGWFNFSYTISGLKVD